MKVVIEVGQTVHKQTVALVAEKQPNASWKYMLVKHAANQLDDTVQLYGLTDAVLESIAKAHAKVKAMDKA